jgi:hypothetical protein
MQSVKTGVPAHYLTPLSDVPAEHRAFFEARNQAVARAWSRTDGKVTYFVAGVYFLRVDENLYDINRNGEREGTDKWDVSDERTGEVFNCYPTLRDAVYFTRGAK